KASRRRGSRRPRRRLGAACSMARFTRADGGRWRSAAMLARLTRTAPAFWESPPGLLADLLLPIGAAWNAVGRLRRSLSRPYRPPIPVVCVGNLVAGGAGKTPVALALSAWLLDHGVRVHVVTRGYGGYLRGPIRVDPSRHDALEVGDEALLLAARTPCWVARDRV